MLFRVFCVGFFLVIFKSLHSFAKMSGFLNASSSFMSNVAIS